MTIARATIKKVGDGTKLRTVDVEALKDEQLPGVEHFETYGLSAVPHTGAEAVIAFIGGSRSHPVVVATGDRRTRPKGRAEGDVTIYHSGGDEIHFTESGMNIKSAGNPITMTVGGCTFKMSSAGLEITGGTIKHNGKDIGDTHTHTGVMPGPANTGPPA